MSNELARYEEGKYVNCKTMLAAKFVYNGSGLYYMWRNFPKIMSNPGLRRVAQGFLLSTFVCDYFIMREFMKNRDRTDCMFM